MKSETNNPDSDLRVSHTSACDIVSQGEHNTRHYLFAKAFAPDLIMNVIHPVEFVFFDVKDDYQCKIHTHRHILEFIIAINGSYCCTINGRSVTLNPMEGILIQRGDVHRDDCTENCRFLALGFEVTDSLGCPWEGMVMNEASNLTNRTFSCDSDVVTKELIDFSEKIIGINTLFMRQAAHSFAQVLIWNFLDRLGDDLTPQFRELLANNLFQQQLTCFFRNNIHTHLSVPQMAKLMGMSRKSLELECVRILGKSPAKAFLSLKLERAVKLIQGGKTSKDVSETLGFNNPYHFSRVFKNHFGMSVSEYCAKR